MDGAIYSIKLKLEQGVKEVLKLPVFKYASIKNYRIETSNKELYKPDTPYEEVLYEHSDIVSKIAKNPWNPGTFISTSWDGSIQYWAFEDSVIEFVTALNNVHKGAVYDAVWMTGEMVVSCGNDGAINKCDVRGKGNTMHFQGDCACRYICGFNEVYIGTTWDSGAVTITDTRMDGKLLQSLVRGGE